MYILASEPHRVTDFVQGHTLSETYIYSLMFVFILSMGVQWNQVHYVAAISWPVLAALNGRYRGLWTN
jgi:hypothetical protein